MPCHPPWCAAWTSRRSEKALNPLNPLRLAAKGLWAGTLRLFAIPFFEGDVRVVTVVDELAAQQLLAQLGSHRKRLLEFLNAAAASPAAAQWPRSSENELEELLERPTELRSEEPKELFPHQVATIEWMQRIERMGRQRMEVGKSCISRSIAAFRGLFDHVSPILGSISA